MSGILLSKEIFYDGQSVLSSRYLNNHSMLYFFSSAWEFCHFSSLRNREIRRMKKDADGGNYFSFICQDINGLEHSAQVNLPRVSVIMPLKGFGEHNLQNWRSQVTLCQDL